MKLLILFLIITTTSANSHNVKETLVNFHQLMNTYKDTHGQDSLKKAQEYLYLDHIPLLLRQEKGKMAAIYLKEIIDRIINVKATHIDSSEKYWTIPQTEMKIHWYPDKNSYLFTAETINQAQTFYSKIKNLPYLPDSGQGADLKDNWREKLFPKWSKKQILGLFVWQWLGLVLGAIMGLLGKIFAGLVLNNFEKITQKSKITWDDQLLTAARGPLSLLGACGVWFLFIVGLQLDGPLFAFLSKILQTLVSYTLVWMAYNCVDILMGILKKVAQKTQFPMDGQLFPLLKKTLQAVIVALGILIILQNFGINVMGLLAGLGLGGLTFALAAKDAVANLFGGLMILLDRPFKVGDYIIVDGIEGTVEEIGLRSTRVRTFYKSLVSVPNSIMAIEKIDNMGQRMMRRFKTNLEFTYQSPVANIQNFVQQLQEHVQESGKFIPTGNHINISNLGASGIQVLIYCFFAVKTWDEELALRQEFITKMIDLAKSNQIDFAYPTQTLHMIDENR